MKPIRALLVALLLFVGGCPELGIGYLLGRGTSSGQKAAPPDGGSAVVTPDAGAGAGAAWDHPHCAATVNGNCNWPGCGEPCPGMPAPSSKPEDHEGANDDAAAVIRRPAKPHSHRRSVLLEQQAIAWIGNASERPPAAREDAAACRPRDPVKEAVLRRAMEEEDERSMEAQYGRPLHGRDVDIWSAPPAREEPRP